MTELTALDVGARLREAAAADLFGPIRAGLARIGIDDARLIELLAHVDERPETRGELLQLSARITGAQPQLVERYGLIRAALHSMPQLPALPVPSDVIALFLQEFGRLAAPTEQELGSFGADGASFAAMCKLATLRRFPAGPFHWEVSGLERSSFLRVRGKDRARLLVAVVRMGGFSPVIYPHNPWRRQLAMLEGQQHIAYYRMAEAMRRQPCIRGLVAESWFHSPDTPRVSPHLAWVNKIFHEWGGVVVRSGAAGTQSGVFVGSARRRELAAEGKFVPTLGLVVWPRNAMLRWAAEYGRPAP